MLKWLCDLFKTEPDTLGIRIFHEYLAESWTLWKRYCVQSYCDMGMADRAESMQEIAWDDLAGMQKHSEKWPEGAYSYVFDGFIRAHQTGNACCIPSPPINY